MAERKNGLVKFTFEGKEFECDPKALHSYSVGKMLSDEKHPERIYRAMELIFAGRDLEYAEAVGDTGEKMAQLANAAAEAVGAKN